MDERWRLLSAGFAAPWSRDVVCRTPLNIVLHDFTDPPAWKSPDVQFSVTVPARDDSADKPRLHEDGITTMALAQVSGDDMPSGLGGA
jgi:hypothetical protein